MRNKEDQLVNFMLSKQREKATKEKLIVDDFAQELFTAMSVFRYAEGTIKNYVFFYNKYFPDTIKNKNIQDVRQSDIRMIYDSIYATGFVYLYRKLATTILNHIFNYAIALSYITESPCANVWVKE